MKIVFFGTSEFAVPILEHLAKGAFRPEIVITTPDAPGGRGQGEKSPPAKIAAERLGIEVSRPETLSPTPGHLTAQPCDLFLVAAYGKILPAELLGIPRLGSLNVHPSLLPRWRGPAPIQRAILEGDEETGVTVMLMDEKVDHGPILKNSKFQISNSKITAVELTRQLADMGAALLAETIPEWVGGKITPQPQDETRATYSRLLRREDGRIDWSKPAEEIERMVRAFQPWPGAYTFWRRGPNELRLAVEGAGSQTTSAGGTIGTVFEVDGQVAVQTGDGALVLERIKMEGGRSMNGSEFLRGHRDIIGAQIQ